jgi:hypothetical protein
VWLIFLSIAMFVLAIVTFAKGKLQVGNRWVAKGGPAYGAAVVLLFPLPCSLGALFLIGAICAMNGQFFGEDDLERFLTRHELAVILLHVGVNTLFITLAFAIALLGAKDPRDLEEEERRQNSEADDWDDDEPPPRY